MAYPHDGDEVDVAGHRVHLGHAHDIRVSSEASATMRAGWTLRSTNTLTMARA